MIEMGKDLNLNEKKRQLAGRIEYFDNQFIRGWAVDQYAPHETVFIRVFEDDQLIEEFSPSLFRWDLKAQGYGSGQCGFVYPIPAHCLDGGRHQLHFRFKETGDELENSPAHISFSEESQSVPFAATNLVGNKVLVLAPHPDDESLGCGGSLILHRDNEDDVKIIFLTDGSKADAGRRYDPKEYVQLREREAQWACSRLGVSDLEFWRIPDRSLTGDEETVKRLCDLIADYKPTLIYAPSPLEFHPDHKAAAALLWKTLQKTQARAMAAFFEYNRPIGVNTLVDITGVIERKKQACDSYASQLANHPYTECAISLNRYRALTVSSFCKYAEGYFLIDSREIESNSIDFFMRGQFALLTDSPNRQAPLVSIIIRTKDRPEMLREALSSLLTQTYPNLEAIVVNDGGEDVSSVIDEFKKRLSLRHRVHDVSFGRAAAANTGLKMAQGKYVNFLDDDDILYPNHVEKLAVFLEKTGETAAYSDCEMGRYRWSGKEFILNEEKQLFMGVDFDRDRLHYSNLFPIMAVMFARKLCEQVGPFDESLDFLEDWDFWIRMSEQATFHHLPGITSEYRCFSNHVYDGDGWRLKLLRKHQHYWSVENLARQTWPRIESLQYENATLRNLLIENQKEYASLSSQLAKARDEINRITGTRGWRLLDAYGRVKHRYLLPFLRLLCLTRSKVDARKQNKPSEEKFNASEHIAHSSPDL